MVEAAAHGERSTKPFVKIGLHIAKSHKVVLIIQFR